MRGALAAVATALIGTTVLAGAPAPPEPLDLGTGNLASCLFKQLKVTPKRTLMTAGQPSLSYRVDPGPGTLQIDLSLKEAPDTTDAMLAITSVADWRLTRVSRYGPQARPLDHHVQLWLGGPLLDVTENQGVTLLVAADDEKDLARSRESMRQSLWRLLMATPQHITTQRVVRCHRDDPNRACGEALVHEVPTESMRGAGELFFENREVTKRLFASLRAISVCSGHVAP